MGCDRCDRCLRDACLPRSLSPSMYPCLSLSLSFLLITSPLLLSFAFHYSIFSSDFYPLALPLPLVSLRLRAVPALMQLVITKPLIWSLNFPNLEKGRGWRKKMKQQRPDGSRLSHHLVRWWEESLSVWRHQNTLSQLSAVQLSSQPVSCKTHWQLIEGSSLPSYSRHRQLLRTYDHCPSLAMHAQERRGKNRSIIERADLFRVWKHRTKERESQWSGEAASDNGLVYLSYSVWPLTMKASSILKASARIYSFNRTQRNHLRLLSFAFLLKSMGFF